MNKLWVFAFAALAASLTAQAAEPSVAPAKPAAAAQTAAAAPAKSAPTAQAVAPVPQKTAALSQQDKMRECNKQATGRKGAERKTFMKTCLSRKA